MKILQIAFREQGNMAEFFREHGTYWEGLLVGLLCTHLGSV